MEHNLCATRFGKYSSGWMSFSTKWEVGSISKMRSKPQFGYWSEDEVAIVQPADSSLHSKGTTMLETFSIIQFNKGLTF